MTDLDVKGLVERLREAYTPQPVPPCSVCGKSLKIQSAGGGNATVYGCEEHRPFDRQHYERSRWTHYRPGDTDVIDALAALEAAEQRVQKLEALVEQAFRDGLAYGSNVASADPDLAWQQSRVRAALQERP